MDAALTPQFVVTLYIALYVLIVAMIVQTVVVSATLWQTRKTHHLVNSQWEEWKRHFMAAAGENAARQRAEGVREGRDQRTNHETDGTR